MSDTNTRRRSRKRSLAKLTFVEIFALVLFLVVIVGSLIPLPRAQQARSGVGKTPAMNNLSRIGLAEHNYMSANEGRFTPSTVENSRGQAVHSWYTLLLPYLDEGKRFDKIDFERSWNDPVNAELFRTPTKSRFEVIPEVEPKETADGWPVIHYAMNSRLFAEDHALTIEDVVHADGSTNTLMFGQISAGLPPWGKPGNARDLALGLNADARTFGWKEYGVTIIGLCDGSVTTISNNVDPRVLKALSTWNGREYIFPSDW